MTPRVDAETPAPKAKTRLHYSSSNSVNPICEKCGEKVFPGMYEEPYTRDHSLWLRPPPKYRRCIEEPV